MKKGFTLIELLAVIVILAIIALILTPTINEIVGNAKKAGFKSSVNNIIDSANNYVGKYLITHPASEISYPTEFVCDGEKCVNEDNETLEFTGKVPVRGAIIIESKDRISFNGLTDGKYCAYGSNNDLEIYEEECYVVVRTPSSCFEYEENENGITITKYLCDGKEGRKEIKNVVIPNKINGSYVTKIGDGSFNGKNIEGVTIPSHVETIGAGAFYDNQIQGISLPEGLIDIGRSAFALNNLRCVNFPHSLENIGDAAFASNQITSSCSYGSLSFFYNFKNVGSSAFASNQIRSVTFYHVENIGDAAFAGSPIERAYFSDGVQSIGSQAFVGSHLTEVNLPMSLNYIGSRAFYGPNLSSVHFASTSNWKVRGGNSSTSIDVSNDKTNATYFTSTYLDYDFTK